MSDAEGCMGLGGADQQKPAAKKQRKLTEADLGGPIEDEETARKKLEDAGFSKGKLGKTEAVKFPCSRCFWYANPMCHFAAAGDLMMCRYLVTQGAKTTDESTYDGDVIWIPMSAAAWTGQTAVCEWLYNHGAQGDICRRNDAKHSPLRVAMNSYHIPCAIDISQWLILHGAIPSDGDGNLDASFMEEAFRLNDYIHPAHRFWKDRERLLKWAEGIRDDHDRFTTFLFGTSPTSPRPSERSEIVSPARCLGGLGYVDIRKLMAEYFGIMTGRNLRTVRQIIGPLQKALSDVDARRRQKQH